MTRKLIYLIAVLGCALAINSVSARKDTFMEKREQMIKEQIMNRDITDKRVIDAMRNVERHLFVPSTEKASSYEDYPLSIGYGQTISQPYIVAYMTQAVQLNENDKVLEIGTGSGYQAAILAEIVKEVYTIEIVKPLAETAKERLKNLKYKNIHVKHGDGYAGWKEHSPFDAIVVTAAPTEIPEKLVEQLAVGGKMIVPVGSFFQELYLIRKTKDTIEKNKLLPVRFVPMVKGSDEK